MEEDMPYGAKGAVVGSSGALATTGFAIAGWVVGAITLILLGIAVLQLVRPAAAHRP
jgi:hypothetical protein